MASSVGVVGFLVVVAALLHCTTAATNHTVGDSSGWTVPTPNTLYTSWINNKVFTVGDNLIFTFITGQHDVLQVPKERYDSCSGTAAIGSSITTGPATVTLTSAGQHYFICTVGTHCRLGQKLAVSVVSSSTTAPPPTTPSGETPPTLPSADSPSPPQSTGGPTPPSSATSLTAGLGVAAALSVITFFF
eukprot:TRINITY_DN18591_c0_g1_i2.p1 TRINITY_DN18591_c0_g1~~TRINITY_DN18591_c0_g1_i2.p1  ORF type:complete len:189 (+),score=15.61 TRINITY_DN18591_c0_g1_i2:95-661(+)